jgi:hypothetical protein
MGAYSRSEDQKEQTMPCTEIGPMMEAISRRVVDPSKPIAQVHGAGQAGCSLWIRGLNEKLWISDTLYFGMWGFVVTATYEPSDDPTEIRIFPCIIPEGKYEGKYQNIAESPADGTLITRGPQMYSASHRAMYGNGPAGTRWCDACQKRTPMVSGQHFGDDGEMLPFVEGETTDAFCGECREYIGGYHW